MSILTRHAAAAFAVVILLLLSPPPVAAQEPELLDIPTFEVTLLDSSGSEATTFNSGNLPTFDIRFALTMSESDRYPTAITLIQDLNGDITESQIFKGSLSEGFYELKYTPSQLPGSRGTVNYRLLVKTRIFTKRHTSTSFYSYRRLEGSYTIGR